MGMLQPKSRHRTLAAMDLVLMVPPTDITSREALVGPPRSQLVKSVDTLSGPVGRQEEERWDVQRWDTLTADGLQACYAGNRCAHHADPTPAREEIPAL